MRVDLPSPSPLLESPREPASTGLCANCQDDFGERAFEYINWPAKAVILCSWCVQEALIKRLQQAQKDGNEDVLTITQSVDEIGKCKDCDCFVCECR